MNRIVRIVVLLAVLAAVASACAAGSGSTTTTLSNLQGEDNGPANAELAPDFSVTTEDGSTFSLDNHLIEDGRPVFLNLWASWCFPCRKEMPAIDAAAKTHTNIQFLGVSIQDTEPEARDFLDEIGVTYLTGFDSDNQVDDAYRPLGLPASYIISAEGVILERIFGEVTEESLAEKFQKYFG